MTRYYKTIDGRYLVGIGRNCGSAEISVEEYQTLSNLVAEKPAAPSGYTYMLVADTLEWELVELPPESEPELTAEEALDILLGGVDE